MSVIENWSKRLSLPGFCAGHFLEAFKAEIKRATNLSEKDKHSDGSRVQLAQAMEAGIRALVLSPSVQRFLKCEEDSERTIEIPHLGIKKTVDVAFAGEGFRLLFEVKTALEFNSLAAAGAEARLFKSNCEAHVVFVLFAIAGKSFDSKKASDIAVEVFGPGTLDKIVVLSEKAGTPPKSSQDERRQRDIDIMEEIATSLDEFESFLKTQLSRDLKQRRSAAD